MGCIIHEKQPERKKQVKKVSQSIRRKYSTCNRYRINIISIPTRSVFLMYRNLLPIDLFKELNLNRRLKILIARCMCRNVEPHFLSLHQDNEIDAHFISGQKPASLLDSVGKLGLVCYCWEPMLLNLYWKVSQT